MNLTIRCTKCAKEIPATVEDNTDPGLVKLLQLLAQRVLCAECDRRDRFLKTVKSTAWRPSNRVDQSQPKETS